jgi:hypothetical protein
MYRTYFDPVYSRDYCEIWQESFQKYLLLCPQAFDGNERTPRRIICKENDLYLVIVIIERTELRTYRVYFLSIVLFILRMLNWSNVWYEIIAFYFSVILGRKIIKSRLYIFFFFFFFWSQTCMDVYLTITLLWLFQIERKFNQNDPPV